MIGGSLPLLYPLSSVTRNIINVHGGISGPFTAQVDWDWTNTAREINSLVDMDGDGFLDHVTPTNEGLMARVNNRAGGFKPPRKWDNYEISHESCSLHNLLGDARGLLLRYGRPVVGAGQRILNLSGPGGISLAGLKDDTEGAAEGIGVSVYHGFTSVFATVQSARRPTSRSNGSTSSSSAIRRATPVRTTAAVAV